MNCIICLTPDDDDRVEATIDFDDLLTYIPQKVKELIIYEEQQNENYDLDVMTNDDNNI